FAGGAATAFELFELGTAGVVVANGASASFEFQVATTEVVTQGGSIAGVVSFSTVGNASGQVRGTGAISSALTAMNPPQISTIGGSYKAASSAAGNAGSGGDVFVGAAGPVTIGLQDTTNFPVPSPNITQAAQAASTLTIA